MRTSSSISLSSEADSNGVSSSASVDSTGRGLAPDTAYGYNILVVDDDVDIRFYLQVLMGKSGYRIRTAANGVEALQQVSIEVPDLILLDIGMDLLDGLQFLRLIRANEPTAQLPVILVSAYSGQHHIEAGKAAGANYYVTKPFEAGPLLSLIQELLPQPRKNGI